MCACPGVPVVVWEGGGGGWLHVLSVRVPGLRFTGTNTDAIKNLAYLISLAVAVSGMKKSNST